MTLDVVVIAVVIGGVLLVLLARWARGKNATLGDQRSAWEASKQGVSFKYLFFGSRSSIESGIGRMLAGLAILFVLVFLAFVGYLLVSSA